MAENGDRRESHSTILWGYRHRLIPIILWLPPIHPNVWLSENHPWGFCHSNVLQMLIFSREILLQTFDNFLSFVVVRKMRLETCLLCVETCQALFKHPFVQFLTELALRLRSWKQARPLVVLRWNYFAWRNSPRDGVILSTILFLGCASGPLHFLKQSGYTIYVKRLRLLGIMLAATNGWWRCFRNWRLSLEINGLMLLTSWWNMEIHCKCVPSPKNSAKLLMRIPLLDWQDKR